MGFFISDALAEAAPMAAQDPGLAGAILPIGIMVAFFFLFILPQQRKTKEHKKMVDALTKGAEVVTNGGLLGKVVDLDETFALIEISENVNVHVQRSAVAVLMPKGTYKFTKKKTDKA